LLSRLRTHGGTGTLPAVRGLRHCRIISAIWRRALVPWVKERGWPGPCGLIRSGTASRHQKKPQEKKGAEAPLVTLAKFINIILPIGGPWHNLD
jgi:hypothetical protein